VKLKFSVISNLDGVFSVEVEESFSIIGARLETDLSGFSMAKNLKRPQHLAVC